MINFISKLAGFSLLLATTSLNPANASEEQQDSDSRDYSKVRISQYSVSSTDSMLSSMTDSIKSSKVIDQHYQDLKNYFETSDATTPLHLVCLDPDLKVFPREVTKLIHIIRLSIHDTQLMTIPEDINLLIELRELDLSGNKLSSLPKNLSGLGKLKVLDLSDNEFTEIPEGLFTLPKGVKISLRNNPLNSFNNNNNNYNQELGKLEVEETNLTSRLALRIYAPYHHINLCNLERPFKAPIDFVYKTLSMVTGELTTVGGRMLSVGPNLKDSLLQGATLPVGNLLILQQVRDGEGFCWRHGKGIGWRATDKGNVLIKAGDSVTCGQNAAWKRGCPIVGQTIDGVLRIGKTEDADATIPQKTPNTITITRKDGKHFIIH